MLREHVTTEWVVLDLEEHRPETGPFEPELEASDAREERADGHLGSLLPVGVPLSVLRCTRPSMVKPRSISPR